MKPKTTEVLLVGTSLETWNMMKGLVKKGLQGMHVGWGYVSVPAPTFHVAFTRIVERRSLDIVHISNEMRLPAEDMRRGCEVLARKIARHPNRPWVLLKDEDDLVYLTPLFSVHGIEVRNGMLENIIHERWAAENKQLADAAE